jgi:hypothetical protein
MTYAEIGMIIDNLCIGFAQHPETFFPVFFVIAVNCFLWFWYLSYYTTIFHPCNTM